jgi:hypothetical protein
MFKLSRYLAAILSMKLRDERPLPLPTGATVFQLVSCFSILVFSILIASIHISFQVTIRQLVSRRFDPSALFLLFDF